MDQLTAEVRYRQWMELIREQRASGQSVRKWCLDNGIKEKTFHYYLRRLREKAAAGAPPLIEIGLPAAAQHALQRR